MTPKETKDYVLLMAIRSMIAKMPHDISKHWRPTLKVLQEDARVLRIKQAPAEAVTFASALSDLFIEMANRLAEAENLQTVAQMMAYLRSARDGEVGIVEETEAGTVIYHKLTDKTPWPEGDNVYLWSKTEGLTHIDGSQIWQVYMDMNLGRFTHWFRLPPPTIE
jgi:hypothetical protein